MKAALRLWLDQDGKAFGDGPYELLRGIEATGSLHKSAAQMGMAYSKAWKLLRMIEQRLGFIMLEREVGGPLGGGSRITPRAKELMSCYAAFRKEAYETVHRIFQKRFPSFIERGQSGASNRIENKRLTSDRCPKKDSGKCKKQPNAGRAGN